MTRRNSGTVRLVNVSVTTYACQKCQKLFPHKCSGAMWGASAGSLELLPASWPNHAHGTTDSWLGCISPCWKESKSEQQHQRVILLPPAFLCHIFNWYCFWMLLFLKQSLHITMLGACGPNPHKECWRNAGGMLGPPKNIKNANKISCNFHVLWPQSKQNSNTVANIDLQSNMT